MYYAIYDKSTGTVKFVAFSNDVPVGQSYVQIPDGIDPRQVGVWSTVSKDGILDVGTRPTTVPTTQELITKAVESLMAELSDRQTRGIYYTPNGSTTPILFSTSLQAQAQYNAAFSSVKSGLWTSGSSFITESGAPVTLSNDDIIAMTTKAMTYVKDCYTAYETLYTKVMSDPSTDITVGWPDNT